MAFFAPSGSITCNYDNVLCMLCVQAYSLKNYSQMDEVILSARESNYFSCGVRGSFRKIPKGTSEDIWGGGGGGHAYSIHY